MLSRLSVLGVFAHPDDECIFGWPVFQCAELEKHLIIVSNDRYNEERSWCRQRGEALAELCSDFGIQLRCFDFDSEFYRLPYRRAETVINDLYDVVRGEIDHILKKSTVDIVVCHNPVGEYGMFDHRLVFDMVYHASSVKNLLVSDLCELHEGWPSTESFPHSIRDLYYHNKRYTRVDMDKDFYSRCKATYDRYGCWTWTDQLPWDTGKDNCNMYAVKEASPDRVSKIFEAISARNAN